jgi:hypothetical protein
MAHGSRSMAFACNIPPPPSTTTPTCIENANDTQCDKQSNKKEGMCIAKQIYNNFDVN